MPIHRVGAAIFAPRLIHQGDRCGYSGGVPNTAGYGGGLEACRVAQLSRMFAPPFAQSSCFPDPWTLYVGAVFAQSFGEAWQASEGMTRRARKTVAEAWQAAEALARRMRWSRSESTQIAEALTRRPRLGGWTETWQAAETHSARGRFRANFAETWGAAELLAKRARLSLAESWVEGEALASRVRKALAEIWGASEAIATRLRARKSFAESDQKVESLATVYHAGGLGARAVRWIKITLGIC